MVLSSSLVLYHFICFNINVIIHDAQVPLNPVSLGFYN